MLDTEQEECQEYEKQELQRSKEEQETQIHNELCEYLFGKASVQGLVSKLFNARSVLSIDGLMVYYILSQFKIKVIFFIPQKSGTITFTGKH